MLDAYMDESGIHENAQLCVAAGYWDFAKRSIRPVSNTYPEGVWGILSAMRICNS